jgi:hypothetical protein
MTHGRPTRLSVTQEHGAIHFLLSFHGGIVPAVRRRSLRALSLAEREGISRGIATASSIRDIARRLERATSVSSQRSGPPGLGVRLAAQGMPSGHSRQTPKDRCE